jgi:hypothetical protein
MVEHGSDHVPHYEHPESQVSREEFLGWAREVMDANWVETYNFTQPNRATYPWMWLWDSCFHSIVYAALGDDRALLEAKSVFRWQTADGMVPHMGYQTDEPFGRAAWSSLGGSTITQPPMYGHMIRVLHERGWDVAPLVEPATLGLNFLLQHRRLPSGLVGVVHPWETGMDNSPRWMPWSSDAMNWRATKDEMVRSLVVNESGAAVRNPRFSVAPASFNALVVFNALELASVCGDDGLRRDALAVGDALEECFDETLETWVDRGPDDTVTSTVRTLDSLLPALVTNNPDRARRTLELTQEDHVFGARYGPSGVDQREASFDPDGYWRGAAWPQLTYLFYVLSERASGIDIRDVIAHQAVEAAISSRFAEYFNPLNGEGRGAIPQSWACLPVAMWR